MKTTKPLSTISYNSYTFLVGTLDKLVKDGFIDFYAMILHEPEEDEEKEHWHVYCEPCAQLDQTWLRKQFMELDMAHPNMPPLGTLKWNKSQFYDWYWYVLHDVDYLAQKGQKRKIHYTSADVMTNDELQLMEYVRENPLQAGEIKLVRDMLMAGFDVIDIAKACHVKVKEVYFFIEGVKQVASLSITDRNGRPNHEPKALEFNEEGSKEDEN